MNRQPSTTVSTTMRTTPAPSTTTSTTTQLPTTVKPTSYKDLDVPNYNVKSTTKKTSECPHTNSHYIINSKFMLGCGPGNTRGKALDYGLDGPHLMPVVGGGGDFFFTPSCPD